VLIVFLPFFVTLSQCVLWAIEETRNCKRCEVESSEEKCWHTTGRWRDNAERLPLLKQLASKYLCASQQQQRKHSFFAASVQAFSSAWVRAFPSCPQRRGCRSDQNSGRLNHNACCFKPFRKPRPARSYAYLKATFSIVLNNNRQLALGFIKFLLFVQ